MKVHRTIALAMLVLAAPPMPAPAQSLDSGSVMAAVKNLKPGEYLWAPQLAPAGPMLLVVNRQTQRLVVYRNGLPIGISTVSTGKPGHRTPTGIFTILQKQVEHYSSLYDSAPMPFMERLTWDGVALHGGTLPGYAASHGCIRLPKAFAERLYGETRLGMTVVVTDKSELPRLTPGPQLLGHGEAEPPVGAVVWDPAKSPSGPVSIVVSGTDAEVQVLRNGVLIGSAPATLATPITRPAAYSLQAIDGENRRWMRLPLPGQDINAPTPEEVRQHVTVDPAFERQVLAAIAPDATVLLTPDSMTALATSTPQPVIEASPADR